MFPVLAALAPTLLANSPISKILQGPAQAVGNVASQALGALLPQGGAQGGIQF
jgi:hypothetical protein